MNTLTNNLSGAIEPRSATNRVLTLLAALLLASAAGFIALAASFALLPQPAFSDLLNNFSAAVVVPVLIGAATWVVVAIIAGRRAFTAN